MSEEKFQAFPPESIFEPPLASVELGIQHDPVPTPPETTVPFDEEKLKSAVRVVEKETPLEPQLMLEPESTARETVTTASGKREVTPVLAAVLAGPESESSEIEIKDQKNKNKSPVTSFVEESNKPADLSDQELRALEDLKHLVANLNGTETSIWGVPLMKDARADVVLLKFLRARDFDVNESFSMLRNTLHWRRDFGVDELVKQDLGDDFERIVFMHGKDKCGHPVCYNVYGEFKNKEVYAKAFADEDKRLRFLRWRIQFLERSIRKLDYSPGGINTIFQVSDLKNSPGPGLRELRIATKQALQMLQDNYPEFVAKQVFINVPWWYLVFYSMMSPFLTQRTKRKFVFSSSKKTAKTLFKYIRPEQVPIIYGGLSSDPCECNPEFTMNDPATEITIKPATKQTIEIIINETCTIQWELRVVGWEVGYSVEFIPSSGYTVIIQKTRKMLPADEPIVSGRFPVGELGKLMIIINNPTNKKKMLLYRFKVTQYTN